MSKQKYEEEIEEILRKYEEEKKKSAAGNPATGNPASTPNPSPRAPIDFRAAQARRTTYSRPPQKSRFTMPNWKRLSAAQYIGMALGAAILAVLVGRAIPVLMGALVIASAVLFLIPFILYRSTGTTSGGYSPTEEKRWRGQRIDYTPRRDNNEDDDPLAGIKRWFNRR